MRDHFYGLLGRLPAWPLITRRTARAREHNAFMLGVDAQRACVGDVRVVGYEPPRR